jgi:hypothetical protein
MTKHLRAVKATLIIGLVLVGTLFSTILISPDTTTAEAKFFTFDSELQITYDADAVNQATFPPDGPPVSIPIYINYRVDIPQAIFSNTLLRIIFLQTIIIFSAQISITVVNQPEWAAVSITPSNPYVNIDNTFQNTTAILQIAAHSDAPAEGFTLKLHATVPPLLNQHIGAKEADLNIIFQPGYIPLINIDVENPSRIIDPQSTCTFKITITNLGNKETLVTGKVIQAPDGWAALLSQTQITIPSTKSAGNNVASLSFSITPPYGFGYHNDVGSILLEFTPQFSPPQGNNPSYIGTPVQVPLIVRSRGFSVPGFEIFGMIIALGISIALIARKQKIKQN